CRCRQCCCRRIIRVRRPGDCLDPVCKPVQQLAQAPRVARRGLRRIQSPAAALDGLNVALDAVEIRRTHDVGTLPVGLWRLPSLWSGTHSDHLTSGTRKPPEGGPYPFLKRSCRGFYSTISTDRRSSNDR